MATSVKEDHEKLTFVRTIDSIVMTRGYTVIFDEGDYQHFEEPYRASIAVDSVESAHKIPPFGEVHPELTVYVNQIKVTPVKAHYYDVLVTYSADLPAGLSVPLDPTERDPVITYYPISTTFAIDKDKDGKPIQNSSEESFDPPPTKNRTLTGMRIVKYLADENYDAAAIAAYNDTVNNAVFLGHAVGTVLFNGHSAEEVYFGSTKYQKVTYECLIDPKLHKLEMFDQGYVVITGDAIKKSGSNNATRIKDGEGNDCPEPTALNGLGGLGDPENPVFLNFDIYLESNLSDLV